MASPSIEVRRIYDDRRGHRGEYRVLVDRLWPRGLARDAVSFDEWAKDLAPSTELRRWYGHVPERFDEFRDRYLAELRGPASSEVASAVVRAAAHRVLVLLTATKDVEHSGAAVLAGHLRRRRRR